MCSGSIWVFLGDFRVFLGILGVFWGFSGCFGVYLGIFGCSWVNMCFLEFLVF